jgi:hypothetical protein
LSGLTAWTFSTGGPAVVSMQPWEGSQIEEDQHPAHAHGPADAATATAMRGAKSRIGERLPVVVVTADPRRAVEARRVDAKRAPRMLLLACPRPLPGCGCAPGLGKGIAAAGSPTVVTRVKQRYGYKVRKPFSAEFSCERERANARACPCAQWCCGWRPWRGKWLSRQPRSATGAPMKPCSTGDRADEVSSHVHRAVPENAAFTIELPREIRTTLPPAANVAAFVEGRHGRHATAGQVCCGTVRHRRAECR